MYVSIRLIYSTNLFERLQVVSTFAILETGFCTKNGGTKMLEIGLKGYQEVMVTEENSAKTMGSGTLDVFATPAMIALMEETAWKSVQPYLEEGQGSVGIQLNVDHVAATPLGMKVHCESEVTAVEGRKLTFKIEAYDEAGLIGKGTHERFVVENEKFQGKANRKLEK